MILPVGAQHSKKLFVTVLKSSTLLRKSLNLVVWNRWWRRWIPLSFEGTEDGENHHAAIEAAGYNPGKDVFIGFYQHHQNLLR